MSFSASPSFTAPRLDEAHLYDGVRTRRILAFLVDYTIVALLMIPVSAMIVLLGILTLGLGFALFAVLFPLIAIPYVGLTLGGPAQATPGMRLLGIRIARADGLAVDPVLAVLHGVVFWAANAVLTPAILLVGLFTPKKQLVQDLLLGTVVLRR